MTCAIKKIDSNITNLAYAIEECLRQLPDTPNWQTLEPNTYSDFGGDVTTTPRTPISNTRQNRKGSVTDEKAAVAFNTDFTQNNLTDLMQGFFFADAHEPKSTAPLNAAKIPLTSVTASSKTYGLTGAGGSLVAGTYFYVISAVNGSGESWASEASNVTLSSTGSVSLTWSAASGATSYNIYRIESSGDIYKVASGVTALSFTDNGTGSAYQFALLSAVTPSTSGGTLADGEYYYTVTALVGGVWTIPSQDTSATVSGGGTSSVALSWSAVTGATNYRVWRGDSGSHSEDVYFETTSTSFTDIGDAGTSGSPANNSLTATSPTLTPVSGGVGLFYAGDLVLASGFASNSNNGLKTVVSSSSSSVVVSESLINESSPPTAAKLHQVGIVGASGDLEITVVDGIPSLISTDLDFTTIPNLKVGAWVFIGGDNTANKFANNVGYARISAVLSDSLTFDDTTFSPVDESGIGKSIQLFIGTLIKNEIGTAIKQRSYTFERQLGEGVASTQAEYVEGCVANQITVNAKAASLMNADLTYVGCDVEYVTGNIGDTLKTGNRFSSFGEDAFNTSSDMVRMKMNILDPATSNPTALFAYVTDATLVINNNATPNQALGVLGAFDVSVGNFTVSGDINAYFADVDAVAAVRRNADVGLNMIFAAQNAGVIFDTPLIGLGGTKVNVTKDQPIMLPLKSAAAENVNGYTALFMSFAYLPTVAMPS